MTRHALSPRRMRALSLATAFAFGATTVVALAQGTPEQREACTPDAVKLCSDTIPDIDKTTACMKAHADELSPRCRAVFNVGGEAPPPGEPPSLKPHKRRIARAPLPDDTAPMDRPRGLSPMPDDDDPNAPPPRARGARPDEAGDPEDFDKARAVIAHLCDDDVIDPGTCAVTERALSQAR